MKFLLGNFDVDVNVVISVAIATNSWDAFTRESHALVGLNTSWDLHHNMTIRMATAFITML